MKVTLVLALFCLVLFVVLSCAPIARPEPIHGDFLETGDGHLCVQTLRAGNVYTYRMADLEAGIVCYGSKNGIHCLPLSECNRTFALDPCGG